MTPVIGDISFVVSNQASGPLEALPEGPALVRPLEPTKAEDRTCFPPLPFVGLQGHMNILQSFQASGDQELLRIPFQKVFTIKKYKFLIHL